MKHFPERLKAARKMNGYSLQDLSDAINNQFNKQALQRLEIGGQSPTVKSSVYLVRRCIYRQIILYGILS